jgi:hypothetical protein
MFSFISLEVKDQAITLRVYLLHALTCELDGRAHAIVSSTVPSGSLLLDQKVRLCN